MNQRTSGRDSYRIIVPTRDSARWIATMLEAYRARGVEPLYYYDIRSSDGTLDILKDLGAQVIAVEPEFDRIECILSTTRDTVDTEWVVRFDDDELPSATLIAWLDQALPGVEEVAIALSRRDVRIVDGCVCFSRLEDYYVHPDDPTYLDPQWRVFRPCEVDFVESIHTPGFHVTRFATAPQRAFFAHFDWILRTFEQRLAKLRRYEQQAPGAGGAWARYYLPELHNHEDLRWTPLETAEFDRLARRLTQLQ